MIDEANVAAKVIKDLAAKIGSKLLTGNISALRGLSTPAYVHSSLTYLDTTPYECTALEHYVRLIFKEKASPTKTM
jgi:hypothetical protein